MSKRPLRIALADEAYEPLFSTILEFVNDRYDFRFTKDRDADFVLHSAGSHEVLKYSGVRIFATGEMVSPDFNVSDYALGFDRMTYGDRYLWLPLCRLYRQAYQALVTPRPPADDVLARKTGFCAYVMSNTAHSAPERVEIFELLDAYRKVASGGSWRNTTGGRVADKIAFQAGHKFVIAFENFSFPGYLTEKFTEAAASDAVPIYWGDPGIGELLNPRAFVNCHAFGSLREAVARVIEVDRDPGAYRAMLEEPWFPDGREPEAFTERICAGFLRRIFDQTPAAAFRRPLGRWAVKHERALRRAFFRPHEQLLRNARRWFG